MSESIAYLHEHTEMSNLRMLDCIIKVERLIDYAAQLNAQAVAITDHESLSGHIKAIQYTKKLKEQNKYCPKLILGNEIYLVDSLYEVRDNYKSGETKFYHAILLAKNAEGHRILRRLSSKAWNDNYFRTGQVERVPTLREDLTALVKASPNNLIFSTACLGGLLSDCILKNNINEAISFINWGKDTFGDDFYLEMQPSNSSEQIIVNKTIVNLAQQTGVKFIVTTDAHYLKKEDLPLLKAYLNSREDESREVEAFYETTYMQTIEEIHQYMDKHIGASNVSLAIKNTLEIADKIEEYDLNHSQVVPKVPIPEFEMEHSFKNAYEECEYIKKFAYSDNIRDRYFLYLIENGWWGKEYKDTLTKEDIHNMMYRINDELGAIWETSIKINDNVASYYITALDIVNMMWDDSENGGGSLVGCSRGSIAAFYVAYLINLQQINPMKYDIPWWRHLHASRPEMPDVDIDTAASKRQRIIEATYKKFGKDKVLNICTFKTEGSKSALLTSCRGLGISVDEAQYIASLIPTVRGNTTSLEVMVYGDEENDIKPNTEFINECNRYDGLLNIALSIEGLICGRSIHASGVIIFETPYYDLNCMMRAPNGQPVTQWNMDDSTYTGGLKFDYLTINNLDAMQKCIDFLLEYNYIEWQGSLRATYNKYFHPDVLDYDSEEMWKMAENSEIINLFQFQTQVGSVAIQKIKPRSLIELGVANAVMRLSAQGNKEQPIDTYVRYKNNIQEWYNTMHKYNLTDEEIKVVENHLSRVYGMATMQEEVMKLSMDEKITNYSMKEANKLRKLIAKKKIALQQEAKQEFYRKGREIGTSDNLLNYVWEECITPQLSYSFSLPHVLGYSTITIQEMNMAYHYPTVIWNCANLIVDGGADEDNEDTTEYGKIGVAISNILKAGIQILHPDINKSEFGFVPNIEENNIIYGLKSISGIGTDAAQLITKNRPYNSIQDFAIKLLDTNLIKPAQMIQLIKSGAFTELHSKDKIKTMEWYLRNYKYEPCSKLTLAQYNSIESFNIIPEELSFPHRVINFKKYVLSNDNLVELFIDNSKSLPKKGYHDRYYTLDENSQPFFTEYFTENSIIKVKNGYYIVSEKLFTKEADEYIKPLKDWMSSDEALQVYNSANFQACWDKYASGTPEAWSMQALNYYDNKHELEDINEDKYGIVNFFNLPEIPETYDNYSRVIHGEWKQFPKYQITRIAGTVINSDNNHHMIHLLTRYGCVPVKFNKGAYSYYNKRISKQEENQTSKKVLEESWFKRGTKLIITGIRYEQNFKPMRYNDTIYQHTCNKILEVYDNGDLLVASERARVD